MKYIYNNIIDMPYIKNKYMKIRNLKLQSQQDQAKERVSLMIEALFKKYPYTMQAKDIHYSLEFTCPECHGSANKIQDCEFCEGKSLYITHDGKNIIFEQGI